MSIELSTAQALIVVTLMGLCGGVTLLLFSVEMGPDSIAPWWCIPSVLGAALGGGAVYPTFGYPGRVGWVSSVFGMLVATLIGSVVAVLLLGFFDVALFAPLFVLVLIVHSKVNLIVWLTFLVIIHLVVRYWRLSDAA